MNTTLRGFVRRARPALGTLVEIGVGASSDDAPFDPDHAERSAPHIAIARAFDGIAAAESTLSRFDPSSDVARFNRSAANSRLIIHNSTHDVLRAARTLFERSHGLFDVTAGTAPKGWALHNEDGALIKLDDRANLDLGGIAKGYIVDRAIDCLVTCGVRAGWVNAGGDLRVFGDVALPLMLRNESNGGVQTFGALADGAFATSHYGRGARSTLAAPDHLAKCSAHVSVAADQCLWADALTKVVALSGDAEHPLLSEYGAQAWLH